MPSSVKFGTRPRIATARSNSSALSPISAASWGVTLLPVFIDACHHRRAARALCALRDAPLRGAPQDDESVFLALKAYVILRGREAAVSKDAQPLLRDAFFTARRRPGRRRGLARRCRPTAGRSRSRDAASAPARCGCR